MGLLITGKQELVVDGTFNWSAGVLGGGLKLINGTLNISNSETLDGATLQTNGNTNWSYIRSYPYMNLIHGATWNNYGTVNIRGDVDSNRDSTEVVNNYGIFEKTTSYTPSKYNYSYLNFAFYNSGIVQAKAGTLGFYNGYTQTKGETDLLGGSIYSKSPIKLQGGTLNIGTNSTVTGDITNSGGLIQSPVASNDLHIFGNYTQGSAGYTTLNIASAASYNTLVVSGSANLGGTLNLNFTNGYVPTLGTSFHLVSSASETGSFMTKANPSGLPNYEHLEYTYGLNGLTATVKYG